MAPLSKTEIEKAQKVKQDRIVTVKESVPRLLADHAISLRDLSPNDSIAVVVHLFDVEPGRASFPGNSSLKPGSRTWTSFGTRKSPIKICWAR